MIDSFKKGISHLPFGSHHEDFSGRVFDFEFLHNGRRVARDVNFVMFVNNHLVHGVLNKSS
jgi:hypothetical protein